MPSKRRTQVKSSVPKRPQGAKRIRLSEFHEGVAGISQGTRGIGNSQQASSCLWLWFANHHCSFAQPVESVLPVDKLVFMAHLNNSQCMSMRLQR